jgi:hypothetical protein
MPITFTIYPLGRLVRYTVEGTSTPNDARAFLDSALAHRRFQRGFMFLGDRRWATEPDAAYVRAMDQEIRSRLALLAPCRWAVVVSTPEAFAAVRAWGILLQGSGVEVVPFMSMEAAAEWVAAGTTDRHITNPAHTAETV